MKKPNLPQRHFTGLRAAHLEVYPREREQTVLDHVRQWLVRLRLVVAAFRASVRTPVELEVLQPLLEAAQREERVVAEAVREAVLVLQKLVLGEGGGGP